MFTHPPRWITCAAALAAVAILSLATPAQATVTLRLTSGASQVTIADGGAGDLNPLAGWVTFIGGVGDFNSNVTTGISKDAGGDYANTPYYAHMDLNSVGTSVATGGTLKIELSDTDFLPFPTKGLLTGDVGGTTVGTATFIAYKDPSNELFGTGGTSITLGPFVGSPSGAGTAFSGTATVGHDVIPTPYSMTLVANITHPGGGSTSFDFSVLDVVPEPSAVALSLSGLPILGLLWARRRRVA